MIQLFIDRFMENKHKLEKKITKEGVANYNSLVKMIIETITDDDEYGDHNPDPRRIHEIDDGDYQGSLVYVIAEKGYQPTDYWTVKILYGSCSGCDTLQAINEEVPSKQLKEYMHLALHVVQGLKEL